MRKMDQIRVPHVLIFPYPAQGHVNSMLKLSELLALFGLHITFLNTEYNQDRLLQFTDVQTRFVQFPKFRFETIPDALPVIRDGSHNSINELMQNLRTVFQRSFKDLMFSDRLKSAGWPPVSCIIADYSFTIEVAKQLGIPSISFRTPSACYFWAVFSIPKVIQAGEIPFGEDADLDELVTSVPGMEGFVRRRDLPSFYRAKDLNDVGLNLVLTETQNSTKASVHILNTFEDLEGPILSQMRPHLPKIYTIGPLHALLESHRKECESTPSYSFSNNSLFEVDPSCITWLDSQPSNSVIYVSFGSLIFMTQKEMLEFWHGLVNSKVHFLWAIRPDSVTDKDEEFETPEELSEGTKARGYMVEWSPQEEVLKHPAVGGFLTHSGWNSTLESIVTGVPMICWPQFADQQTNSRFVSETWKIGLDMKDQCDRSLVERLVKDLMEDKREEIVRSSDKMKELAEKSVSKGGSSYSNLDELIQDIKSMKIGV